MGRRMVLGLLAALAVCALAVGVVSHPGYSSPNQTSTSNAQAVPGDAAASTAGEAGSVAVQGEQQVQTDYWPLLFVFALSTFIGLGVIIRVSRLLHTPLMSLTNAISAIAVVGSIIVTGSDYPRNIRILGAVALFASMTNIVSGFLITDRMLKMFKTEPKGAAQK